MTNDTETIDEFAKRIVAIVESWDTPELDYEKAEREKEVTVKYVILAYFNKSESQAWWYAAQFLDPTCREQAHEMLMRGYRVEKRNNK